MDELQEELEALKKEYQKSGYALYKDTRKAIADTTEAFQTQKQNLAKVQEELTVAEEAVEKATKQLNTQTRKTAKIKELYKCIEHALKVSQEGSTPILLSKGDTATLEELCPSVTLKLNCLGVKDLRKEYKANEKNIDALLESYSKRYNTKANKTIYALMVIALRAEMQNILYNLKYAKHDESIPICHNSCHIIRVKYGIIRVTE